MRYLLLVALVCFGMYAKSQERVVEMDILHLEDKPIITGKINGKNANFLIDTGSPYTILYLSDAKHFGFKTIQKANRTLNISGFGNGSTELVRIYNLELEFAQANLYTSFCATSFHDFIQATKNYTGLRIHGIIGTDLMQRYSFQVDYAREKVLFLTEK